MGKFIIILKLADRVCEAFVKKTVVFTIVLLCAASPAAAQKQCMSEVEIVADKIRFLQTQLMVAALQCRQNSKGMMPKIYNAYVKKNRSYISESSRHLKAYLQRYNQGSLSSYLTETANRLSLETINDQSFCAKMKIAGEMALMVKNPIPVLNVLPVAYVQPAKICLAPKWAAIYKTK